MWNIYFEMFFKKEKKRNISIKSIYKLFAATFQDFAWIC